MRTHVLAGLIFVGTIGAAAAQTGGPEPAQPVPAGRKDAAKALTLSGCVQPAEAGSSHYTLADDTDKIATTYRLSGTSMKKYAGRRVEIVGGVVSPRVKIVGGLLPSPNAAAQAGAMDPSQAAIAGGAGSGPGTMALPEFRVRAVRPLAGTCGQ
jgi:hypothetical protein